MQRSFRNFVGGVSGLVLILASVGPAQAGLIGASVNSTYYFPDLGSPFENDGTQTVSPTASFTAFGIVAQTVSDTQIAITNVGGFDAVFSPGAFNGPVFDVLAGAPTITGVSVNGATNIAGFNASLVTISSDGAGGQLVAVNFQSLPFNSDANATLDLQFAVPEPATLTLLGLGVAGLAGYGLRKRQRAASSR